MGPEEILDMIDHAVEDHYAIGPDAMRWMPEKPKKPEKPLSLDWNHVHVTQIFSFENSITLEFEAVDPAVLSAIFGESFVIPEGYDFRYGFSRVLGT